MTAICLRQAAAEADLALFWRMFDRYIREIFENSAVGDSDDVDYFFSPGYRNAIRQLHQREADPVRILLFEREGINIGFAMYVIYLQEQGKCFLMEYGVVPEMQGCGMGTLAYRLLEDQMRREGASYVELTPSNENNTRFWQRNGFVKTDEVDDDNKPYYWKQLS